MCLTMIKECSEEELIGKAREAMERACVPFIKYKVGAAVWAENDLGEKGIYEGCNIQSYISGLGICAERCAIDHAILHNMKRIKMIAIVTNHPDPIEVCGMCLQYLCQFKESDDIRIIRANAIGRLPLRTFKEMLPHPFELK